MERSEVFSAAKGAGVIVAKSEGTPETLLEGVPKYRRIY